MDIRELNGLFDRNGVPRSGGLENNAELIGSTVAGDSKGVGSPVGLVDVEFSASTNGPGIRLSVADGKSLATDAAMTYVGGKVAELFLPDDPRIGLSAFGPSAVIDEHGDATQEVDAIGIDVRPTPACRSSVVPYPVGGCIPHATSRSTQCDPPHKTA